MAGSTTLAPHPSATYCMFCGGRVSDPGEAYYDHLRLNKGCESAWRTWRENLFFDHPGGD